MSAADAHQNARRPEAQSAQHGQNGHYARTQSVAQIHRCAHQYEQSHLSGNPQLGEFQAQPLGHNGAPPLQAYSGAHYGQKTGEGEDPLQSILRCHQQEGQGQQDHDLHRVPHMDTAEPLGQQPPQQQACRYAGEDGGGNAQYSSCSQPCAAGGQSGESGEHDDDKDVIHRGTGQNKLGDTLVHTPALFAQTNHPGHDHCRGYRSHHGSHDGGIQGGNAQQRRSQQGHAQDFKAGGDKAHEDCRAAHPLQSLHIQGEACPGQNNDQRQLPQVCRNIQQAVRQQIQGIGT